MRPSYSEIQAVLVPCQLGTGGRAALSKVLHGEAAPPQGPTHYLFIYHLLGNGTSLTYVPSLELCIPLNCCNCPVFKIWINYKPERYVHFFHSPFGPFYQPKWQSSPPFHIPEAWKWYHFRAELPRKAHCGDYPPGLGITNFRRKVNFKLV